MIWIYTSNMCKCWRRRAFSVKHQRFILALLMLNLPGFFATSIISRHLWGFAITGNMVTSLSNQPTMVLVYHERYVTRDVPVCWRWVNHESPHSEVKIWKPEDGVGIGSMQLAQMWTLMSFLSNLLNFTVKICSKHEEIPLHQGAPCCCCCCCCCCCGRPRRRRSFIALAGGLSSEEALLQWLDVRRPKGLKIWYHFLRWLHAWFIYTTGWWFQVFFIFIPTWGHDPIWLIFFRWVETTLCQKTATLHGKIGRYVHTPAFGFVVDTDKRETSPQINQKSPRDTNSCKYTGKQRNTMAGMFRFLILLAEKSWNSLDIAEPLQLLA